MAMVFPTSPTVGQVFTSGGRSWVWNGSTWDSPRTDNPPLAIPTGNVIINGGFEINQRGLTSSTAGGFGFDRWNSFQVDGTVTQSAQTFTPGFAPTGYEAANFIRIVTSGQTSTTAEASLRHQVEDVRTLAGQTATLSFFAKAGSGTPKISVEYNQNFGSGGSTRVDTDAGSVTLSTSWQRYSVTITIPSISGKTVGSISSLGFRLWLSAGSNYNARTGSLGIQSNTFDIWGVQLESGAVATPFRRNAPSIQAELAACQRYFIRLIDPPGSGVGTGGTTGGASRVSISLPTEMRVRPSITASGTFNFWNGVTVRTGTWLTSGNYPSTTAVEMEFNLDAAFTQGDAVKMYTSNSTSKIINLSAEL
jgi:hypothetical protein